jgi:phosphoribosylanthranilate isomerase
VPTIKFCGLMRPRDAAYAAALGARYVGVIFAGGPRTLTATRARDVFAAVTGTGVERVGVWGAQPVDEILRLADEVLVDVIQLHGGVDDVGLRRIRDAFGGRIWTVIRTSGSDLPDGYPVPPGTDGVVLDAAVTGMLGGTGVAIDWTAAGRSVDRWRSRSGRAVRIVLAGGLRPGNVRDAVALVRPDVVDVSSGVESAPGIKDPELMRAFASAARGTSSEE